MRQILFIYLLLLCGCSFPTPSPVKTQSEAEKYFLEITQKDYGYSPTIKTLSNQTVWIYLPIETNILGYKANKDSPKTTALGETPKILTLNYLNGWVETSDSFSFEYDVSEQIKYPSNSPGLESAYTEEFSKIQNNLYTSVYRAFGDLENGPSDPQENISINKPPEFFVIVIADIKTGIKVTLIFNYQDFKRFMEQSLPQEEFSKRNISRLDGDEAAIGDKTGNHLAYQEIVWPEFLIKQIQNRIRFKYQSSSFPPTQDEENEILDVIAETFKNCSYENFKEIKLKNLKTGVDYTFSPEQLKTMTENK